MKNKHNRTFLSYGKVIWEYLLKIGKRWYFWISFLPNLASLILVYFKIPYQIPPYLNILIPLFGFLVASFLVYKELLDTHSESIIPNPKIEFSLVEGNEYSFSIDSPYETITAKQIISDLKSRSEQEYHYEEDVLYIEGRPQYWLPKFELTINLKFNNVGNISFDLLLINIDYFPAHFSPLKFYLRKMANNFGEITYPVKLEPSQFVVIQIIYILKPDSDAVVTNAQITASMNQLRKTLPLTLKVDTLNSLRIRKGYTKPLNISFRPLVDEYISQLKHFNQEDLLRLIDHAEK
jgi:hypothetical protein